MTQDQDALVAFSCQEIKKGSKSFAFASFFLSPRERAGAWLLYSFCRYCDDQIDHATEPKTALVQLEQDVHETLSSLVAVANPHLEGLRLVCSEFKIPHKYPLDLLRGMRMDVEGRRYQTLEELQDYCYCVAGVVGLMMCHIMGVSHEKALDHAVSLGSAMQLTNISRDVMDDWKMGRIYFPLRWLAAADLSVAEFGSPRGQAFWAVWAEQLLNEAQNQYQHGRQGLSYLSPKAALACGIASSVYSRIGQKVLRRKSMAWHRRCFVPLYEKIVLALLEGFRLALTRWQAQSSWTPTPIQNIWSKS